MKTCARRRTLGGGAASPGASLLDAAFYYKFESDGTDSSTGANTLTNNNICTFGTGKLGNAVYLAAASSQYMSHTDASAYNMSGTDFTLAAWVYATTITNFTAVMSKDGAGATRDFSLLINNAGTWRFIIFDAAGGADFVDWTGDPPEAGIWYWIVAERNVSGTLISINVNNGTASTASTSRAVGHSATPFYVGARPIETPDQFWPGRIDSACGYKRLWTPTEKTTMFNTGTGFDPF